MALANIALKASRLARLLNHFDARRIMEYRAGGGPSVPAGVVADISRLAVETGREYQQKKGKTGHVNTGMGDRPFGC